MNESNSNQFLDDHKKIKQYLLTNQYLLDKFKNTLQFNSSASSGLSVILNSNRISWKAKAIAITILNNENHFLDISINKENLLQELSKEGIECIKSGIKELQKVGLLYKKIHRNTEGRKYITGSTWHINIMHKKNI